MKSILGPELTRKAECEAVLRSLPQWFGIEESLLEYVEATEALPTFAWQNNGVVCGFISLKQHFKRSWEIYCLAVHSEHRKRQVGTLLVTHAESWLRNSGALFLQVKTLAPSNPSAAYAETRAFYQSRGFEELEVFPSLWSLSNPALQLVKVLNAG